MIGLVALVQQEVPGLESNLPAEDKKAVAYDRSQSPGETAGKSRATCRESRSATRFFCVKSSWHKVIMAGDVIVSTDG